MVVRDLDVHSVPVQPSEADTPLIVDPNAHLACPIPFQGFEPIAGRIAQVVNRPRSIQLAQFAKRSFLNVPRGTYGSSDPARFARSPCF